jgi:hypothetical protein
MNARLIAVLLPALATAALAAPAVASASAVSTEAVSENWAGYEATTTNGSGFSAVSGSWIQPRVACSSGSGDSAYWVGLGGGSGNASALEQQGTQADCSRSGQATYYAWYELVPAAPVKVPLAIHPGDRIWSRTAVSGDQVTVQLDNKTTGQQFQRTLQMTNPAPDTATAEWVAEAPSTCRGGATGVCQPLPLSDFGSVRFTNAFATAQHSTRSISGWNAQPIALSPAADATFGYGGGYGGGFSALAGSAGSPSEGASPGPLGVSGSAFTVTYGASPSLLPSTSSGAAGYGDSGGYGYGDSGGYGYGSSSGYGDGGASSYGYGASGYGYFPSGAWTIPGIYGYGYGASLPGGWVTVVESY